MEMLAAFSYSRLPLCRVAEKIAILEFDKDLVSLSHKYLFK